MPDAVVIAEEQIGFFGRVEAPVDEQLGCQRRDVQLLGKMPGCCLPVGVPLLPEQRPYLLTGQSRGRIHIVHASVSFRFIRGGTGRIFFLRLWQEPYHRMDNPEAQGKLLVHFQRLLLLSV